MKSVYRVTVTWNQPTTETFQVVADDEEEAKEKAIDDNDDIGEDYDIDRVQCIGEVPEPPEPDDPNQLKLFDMPLTSALPAMRLYC